jgi:hypothetical protein
MSEEDDALFNQRVTTQYAVAAEDLEAAKAYLAEQGQQLFVVHADLLG